MIKLTTKHNFCVIESNGTKDGIYYKGSNLTSIEKGLNKPLNIWFFSGNIFEENHLQSPTASDARWDLLRYMTTEIPELIIRRFDGSIVIDGKLIEYKNIDTEYEKDCVEYVYKFENKQNICAQVILTKYGSYTIRVFSEVQLISQSPATLEIIIKYKDMIDLLEKDKEEN